MKIEVIQNNIQRNESTYTLDQVLMNEGIFALIDDQRKERFIISFGGYNVVLCVDEKDIIPFYPQSWIGLKFIKLYQGSITLKINAS